MWLVSIVIFTLQKGGMIGSITTDLELTAPSKNEAVAVLKEDGVLSEDSKVLSAEIIEAIYVEEESLEGA
jgi:hypothetical protein